MSTEEQLQRLEVDWCGHPDFDDVSKLITEVRRLRSLVPGANYEGAAAERIESIEMELPARVFIMLRMAHLPNRSGYLPDQILFLGDLCRYSAEEFLIQCGFWSQ